MVRLVSSNKDNILLLKGMMNKNQNMTALLRALLGPKRPRFPLGAPERMLFQGLVRNFSEEIRRIFIVYSIRC